MAQLSARQKASSRLKSDNGKQQYLSHQSALTDYEKMLQVGSGLDR